MRRYLTQQSAFEAVGAYSGGLIDIEELHEVEKYATPCPGTCGGMFTANTMAAFNEAVGMSLPGSASAPAMSRKVSRLEHQHQLAPNQPAPTKASG